MSFENLNLNRQLLNALDDMGIEKLTSIQEKAFAPILSGIDVCGIAQTGTGKTIAYLLPSLRQFQFQKDRSVQILILVPTRELVLQVVETVQQLGKYLSLKVTGIYGGVNMKSQEAELQGGSDVIVATPGRLIDFLMQGKLKLKGLKKLVLDEMDEMLNLGFRPQLSTIFDLLPPKRQNLLFSATITEDVTDLFKSFFGTPLIVEAGPSGQPAEKINQYKYLVPNFYTKLNLLADLLLNDESMSRVLVFTSTKSKADLVFATLGPQLHGQVSVIHSNKSQNNRIGEIQKFEGGTSRILIATDLLARGIDVAEVTHVINFDVPESPESYVHRVGRTGRAGQSGKAITFVSPFETELFEAIEIQTERVVPEAALPAELDISEKLLPEEQTRVSMPMVSIKVTKPEDGGGAFHEKKAKNSKVNVRRDHAAEKRLKYGRPIKRSGKKQ